jgi:hypothetical protein
MTITQINQAHDDIGRITSENDCYYSVKSYYAISFLNIEGQDISYKIIILLVVFHGCYTLELSSREHELQVFESKVPRKMFRPRKVEVCEQCSFLHNKELRDLYRSLSTVNIVRSRML